MLFLIDVGHASVETAKMTRRYLLGHRRILKKGDFSAPSVNPIFQKENGGLKCNISKPPFYAARPSTTVLLCRPVHLSSKEKADKPFAYWQRNIGSASMCLAL